MHVSASMTYSTSSASLAAIQCRYILISVVQLFDTSVHASLVNVVVA